MLAEGWNAECLAEGVRKTGVNFIGIGIGIGLGFLVAGVLAEWWARRLRARWTADGTLAVPKHDHLKAILLQRDLRAEAGLCPEKSDGPDELDSKPVDGRLLCAADCSTDISKYCYWT